MHYYDSVYHGMALCVVRKSRGVDEMYKITRQPSLLIICAEIVIAVGNGGDHN